MIRSPMKFTYRFNIFNTLYGLYFYYFHMNLKSEIDVKCFVLLHIASLNSRETTTNISRKLQVIPMQKHVLSRCINYLVDVGVSRP